MRGVIIAAITKVGVPSISTAVPPPTNSLSGLISNDAISAGDACYIGTDGLVVRSTGAAANAAAIIDGYAAQAAPAGQSVSLYWGVNFNYGTGLTPGTMVYLSGSVAGGLDTVASTGGVTPCGRVIDATRIYLTKKLVG